MRTRACEDPAVMASVRERAGGRSHGSGDDHIDGCEACSLEAERLRRLVATFKEGRPGMAQLEEAWKRFDDPAVVVRSPVSWNLRLAWAFAAVAVMIVASAVWVQMRRAPGNSRFAATLSAPQPSSLAITPELGQSSNPLGEGQGGVDSNGPPQPSDNPGELDDGERKARKMLEPRVFSGRGTIDEARMLKAICRHQKDAACVARANQILVEMATRSPDAGSPVDAGAQTVLDEGESKARRMLEPRVMSGRATIDEVRMLKAICRHQKDTECVERANGILAEMQKQ